ncbi:MAG: hypothetical protein ACO3XJ_06920, partial [Candidatus Nanopelagicales bacterium]
MTNPFGKPTTRIFSNHKFQVRPISMKALADDVPTAVIDVVEIPEDAPLTNDLPLLRICNPKVTTNELIALADSGVLGTARELLIFHPKLPLGKAVEIASLMEYKSWEYESSEEYLNSLSASDLESAIQDFDYDDEEVTYAGFTRDMAIRAYLSKNPKSMAYLEENAPNLLRKFDELVEAGLFKFYVMYSPITGNLGYDVIRYEHSGAALLTEFVRMKRDGDIYDEDAFSIADWDEDSEDEFDEFITELREAGFGDDGTTEAELGTALHLPNTYILDGITLESSFELSYSSFFVSVLSDRQKGVVDFQEPNENAPIVGVHGHP